MLKLTHNFKNFDSLKNFSKDLKENIIDNGLDQILGHSLSELKKELEHYINEEIRTVKEQNEKATTSNVEKVGSGTINVAKSEEEILKHLTSIKDIKTLTYSSPGQANIIFGHYNKGTRDALRLNFRLELSDGDTVESAHNKAVAFFNNTVFAIPDSTGKNRYYINPGIDLSEHVKIKCSVFTGSGDKPAKRGLNPTERFKRDIANKGYADWTLKQSAITDVVLSSFIDITDTIDFLKQGNIETAKNLIAHISQNKNVKDLSQKIIAIENREQLPESLENYLDAIDLVKNMKFSKKVSKEDVTYNLVSTYSGDLHSNDVEFFITIKNKMRMWLAVENINIFNAFKKKLERLIGKYS